MDNVSWNQEHQWRDRNYRSIETIQSEEQEKKKNNDYKLTGHKRPMEHHIAYQDTYSSCMGK